MSVQNRLRQPWCDICEHWQQMLECMATQLSVPFAMINVVRRTDLVALAIADGDKRFYNGQRFSLAINSYCSNVIRRGEELFVQDVRRLPAIGAANPTAALGLIHYYGEPIRNDAGQVVGTVCVMDTRSPAEISGTKLLVSFVRDAIERELKSVEQTALLEALHCQTRTSVKTLLGAMERSGLSDSSRLKELGFTDDELSHHQALAGLAARRVQVSQTA